MCAMVETKLKVNNLKRRARLGWAGLLAPFCSFCGVNTINHENVERELICGLLSVASRVLPAGKVRFTSHLVYAQSKRKLVCIFVYKYNYNCKINKTLEYVYDI